MRVIDFAEAESMDKVAIDLRFANFISLYSCHQIKDRQIYYVYASSIFR